MNNLSSYFGLVNAKIRVSGKDLPVNKTSNANEAKRDSFQLNKCIPNKY